MKARKLHRLLGLVLLLPLLGWAATALVFFVKPGYEAAYASLQVQRLPLEAAVAIEARPEWLEVRRVRTVLGEHLLVRTGDGLTQLDPRSLAPRPLPDEADLRRLVDEAIAGARARYGEIATVERSEADASATLRTTTGVEIALDWNSLGLQQSGRDTRRIDALYRVHYLQWTGIRWLDRVLGVVGLAALALLTGLGVKLALGQRA